MTRLVIDLLADRGHTARVASAAGGSADQRRFEIDVIDLDEPGTDPEVRASLAEAELRAQALLLAEAEHRLKTSASVIMGWAETLDERWDELAADELRHGITVIRRVAGELVDRAAGLLLVASAQLGVLEQRPASLDLVAVVEGARPALEAVAPRHRLVVAADGPVHVLTVEIQVREVLEQLVENAGKYAPAGSTITVAVGSEPGAGVLAVADEGPGLPDDVDVFAAFRRGPETAGVPGVGIGLHLVRSRLHALGGSVTAGTGPSGGALLTVRLPAA